MKFGLKSLLFTTLLVSLLLSTFVVFDRFVLAPSRIDQSIERSLRSILAYPPPDLSSDQWQVAVDWTINLHRHSCLQQCKIGTLRKLEEDLSQLKAHDVDMETVYWIWNRYAKITADANKYQKFKIVMIEEMKNAATRSVNRSSPGNAVKSGARGYD